MPREAQSCTTSVGLRNPLVATGTALQFLQRVQVGPSPVGLEPADFEICCYSVATCMYIVHAISYIPCSCFVVLLCNANTMLCFPRDIREKRRVMLDYPCGSAYPILYYRFYFLVTKGAWFQSYSESKAKMVNRNYSNVIFLDYLLSNSCNILERLLSIIVLSFDTFCFKVYNKLSNFTSAFNVAFL